MNTIYKLLLVCQITYVTQVCIWMKIINAKIVLRIVSHVLNKLIIYVVNVIMDTKSHNLVSVNNVKIVIPAK